MRILVCILSILISGIAHAEVYKCEVSQINGTNPAKPSSVTFDPGRLLLDVNRGNGFETLLGTESMYVIEANAIWYDRASECNYKRIISGDTFRHTFDCGSDVKAKITLNWNRAGAMGDFESVLEVPNMLREAYRFDFRNCRLSAAH